MIARAFAGVWAAAARAPSTTSAHKHNVNPARTLNLEP